VEAREGLRRGGVTECTLAQRRHPIRRMISASTKTFRATREMEATELQAYDDWLADHMEGLVAEHPGKVVAILDGTVVKVGESETDVYRWAKEARLRKTPLALRVPTERDLRSIL